MERGTIEKILDYYFSREQFEKEIIRAEREFFNKVDFDIEDSFKRRDEDTAMFNEWFIFDFKLSNGKTPLEDFYERNPYNLNLVRLQIYKDLQENYFGFYEVKEVKLGEGLTLENLHTGKIYQVREYSGTFYLKEGQVFSTRVGKVGDHYELAGSQPSIGPIRLDAYYKKLLSREKILNPKILRDSFMRSKKSAGFKDKSEKIGEKFSSLEEAKENLKKALTKYDLEKFVNTETIKEWIYNYPTEKDESPLFGLNILSGLLNPDRDDYSEALMELIDSFNNFYIFCPQKKLGGKSPLEKKKEHEEKGIPPDLMLSCQKFPLWGWNKKYSKALQYMREGKFKQALKKLNEVFKYLLENKTTFFEVYRFYANKGVCHFALGEAERGKFMLEIAVKLNPFYDFAKNQLKNYNEKKEFRLLRIMSKIRGREKDINKDIAYQYYQFLEPLKINFVHPLKKSRLEKIKRPQSKT